MNKNKIKKVGVVGIGPVGMIIATLLKDAGCEVAISDIDKNKLDLIEKEGAKLEGGFNKEVKFDHVYNTVEELETLDLDLIILALKANYLGGVVEKVASFKNSNFPVVCAMNGIDTENIASDIIGESRTLRMVINFAGNLFAPNITKVTFVTPPTYLASIDDAITETAEHLAEWFKKADLEVKVINSFDLLGKIWEKTILNAALSPLCGVGKLTMAEAMNDPDTVELIEQIINEGVEVAEKEKIRFPDTFVRSCMKYLKKGGDHFPSLAGDLINNRPTEIDYFNGKIVEYGKKHYVRTSLNLAFTNMVKAMTNKNIISRVPGVAGDVTKKILNKGMIDNTIQASSFKNVNCYLGIDLGSAYYKFTVIDDNGNAVFHYLLPTLTGDKQSKKNVMNAISSSFNIKYSCATGYGRKHFVEADIIKTEISCATTGVSFLHPGEKNILDIGGEDIKVIKCSEENVVANFYMNDKCAAGTGSFLSEIAEQTNINIANMSSLASLSTFDKELNSFCTVFAKTEIMNWIFDGMSPQDISRGIYISIANKVAKMRIEPNLPTFMIGGVIGHHPYLKTILTEKFNKDIEIVEHPQFVVSHGAALIAKQHYEKNPDVDSKAQPLESLNS